MSGKDRRATQTSQPFSSAEDALPSAWRVCPLACPSPCPTLYPSAWAPSHRVSSSFPTGQKSALRFQETLGSSPLYRNSKPVMCHQPFLPRFPAHTFPSPSRSPHHQQLHLVGTGPQLQRPGGSSRVSWEGGWGVSGRAAVISTMRTGVCLLGPPLSTLLAC